MATHDRDFATLQPDDNLGEVDSALGDDQSSLTQSLRSSLLDSVKENGRNYHRYESKQGGPGYIIPEDEAEQDRQDLQHEMYLYAFDGKLYKSPLIKENIKDVLDIGTGTGIWSIDFADEHPDAQVIGTDLSPIQPQYVPSNCKFEIDDFNSEWTFGQKFDFIHARALCAASKDWESFVRQAYNALKPGGWLEMPDITVDVKSRGSALNASSYSPFLGIDDSIKGSKLEEWGNRQFEACAKLGIDSEAAAKRKQMFIDQGFENVTELEYKWPIGTWPKDPKQKYLGKLTMLNTSTGLEGEFRRDEKGKKVADND